MDKEREGQLEQKLKALKHNDSVRVLLELLALRYERHRERLVAEENSEVRGKAKECRDLLQLFD